NSDEHTLTASAPPRQLLPACDGTRAINSHRRRARQLSGPAEVCRDDLHWERTVGDLSEHGADLLAVPPEPTARETNAEDDAGDRWENDDITASQCRRRDNCEVAADVDYRA